MLDKRVKDYNYKMSIKNTHFEIGFGILGSDFTQAS